MRSTAATHRRVWTASSGRHYDGLWSTGRTALSCGGGGEPAQLATLRSMPGYRDAALRAKRVAKVSNARGILDLAGYWTLVVAAFALLVATDFHGVAVAAAFIAIAKAQNSLLLVGHEAIHYLLLRNRRLNELAGEYLTYAPMGIGYRRARLSHLEHHRTPLREVDEKIDQQLAVPSRRAYLLHLGAPLLGSYVAVALSRFLGLKLNRRARPTFTQPYSSTKADLTGILVAQAVMVAVLFAVDWRLYVFFWILPLFTLTAFLHRAKGFLDHAMLPGESPDLAYSYRVNALDRLFFGTLQAFHAEHHLFPGVPHYRLKSIFENVADLPFVRRRGSYFGFLVDYYRAVASGNK